MRFLLVPTMAMLVSGCVGFQSIESMSTPTQQTAQTSTQSVSKSKALAKLDAVYKDYRGTPYRYGGTDRSGFDCSGFINTAFSDAFRLSLPRTTEQLANNGSPVRRDQLKAGDIIIFQTSVKQLHAGIYTHDGKFIHASTSKGVIESDLSNQYWLQRYVKARRYL